MLCRTVNKQYLYSETSSLVLLQILHSHFNNFTKLKILHWGKTNNFWTIALSGLPQNNPGFYYVPTTTPTKKGKQGLRALYWCNTIFLLTCALLIFEEIAEKIFKSYKVPSKYDTKLPLGHFNVLFLFPLSEITFIFFWLIHIYPQGNSVRSIGEIDLLWKVC